MWLTVMMVVRLLLEGYWKKGMVLFVQRYRKTDCRRKDYRGRKRRRVEQGRSSD